MAALIAAFIPIGIGIVVLAIIFLAVVTSRPNPTELRQRAQAAERRAASRGPSAP